MKNSRRAKKIPGPETGQRKKPIITRRFIIAISLIYSLLIIGTAAAFHVTAQMNTAALKDALAAQSHELLAGRIENHVGRLRSANAATPDAVKKELLGNTAAPGSLHAVIIFTKTEDENYFRIADSVIFSPDLKLDLAPSAVVREGNSTGYLKKGLLHPAVDPGTYSQGAYTWQNVYYPYEFGRRKAVLQFMAAAESTQETIERYAEETGRTRTFMIALTLFLVIAVALLTIIFLQNYSLLIRNLSRYMKKAADGDLNVTLHPAEDVELNQLALSFNTLIEELKEKTARGPEAPAGTGQEEPTGAEPAQGPEAASGTEAPPEAEGPGAIFAAGVSLLKENRLDDAIAIFTTMTIIKPNGFGSFFNLGVAYAKKRDYDAAIRMFESAQRINPSYEVTSAYIEKIKRLRDPDD